MTTMQLQLDLTTPEGFARRVKLDRRPLQVASILLTLAIAAVLYNLFSTFQTMMEYPGSNFLRIFLSTQGENESDSFYFAMLVYGPLILLPIALVFFLYALVTGSRVKHAAFRDFQSRGYLARQVMTGLAVQLSRDTSNTTAVTALSHPSIAEEDFNAATREIITQVSVLDKKASKQLSKAAVKAGVAKAIAATTLFPTAPPAVLLTTALPSEFVAVIPTNPGGGKSAARVLELK